MGDLFLAIDAGGTAVKAAVFDARGKLVALRAVDVTTVYRENGWVEREPKQFWESTAQAIRQLTSTIISPERIAAITCTGFGNGVFLVDANGQGTRDGIVSVDHRAQSIVDAFLEDGTAAFMETSTGHRIWGGQTIMQLIWLARNEPDVVKKTRWALACKDYVRMQLTGIAATDPTDASGGGLLNLIRNDYDEEYFNKLGISSFFGCMPPLVDNSAIAGRVTPEAATQTGLLIGTPVVTGMMDVSSCVIGSGVIDSDALTMIAGTWSINAVETQQVINNAPPILNMLHRDRTCRMIAEGSPTSAGNLNWYLSRAAGGLIDIDIANALVAASAVVGRRCHFMPFLNGPAPRQGAYIGLGSSDDQGSMLRALFEGVAFQHRRHGESIMEYVAPQKPVVIRLAGGASKSEVWAQIFADICGLPVEVSEGEEIGALGAAICAAVATGFYPDIAAATKSMCRITRTASPKPELRDFYDERYNQFLMLDRKLAGLFA
ncbi:carbohydrate kinase [Brucellaceae bacterium VT-16-1752]|nr:carbohydrate kinase [Brucellaceae bacterium VT-16-1752]